MILPITVYGNPILRKVAEKVTPDYPGLKELIDNMWETMYFADGVGLAAPQINKSLRLIVIDGTPFSEDDPSLEGFKVTLINPEILEFSGPEELFNEGCLSLPTIREDVSRPTTIKIKYFDADFIEHTEVWSGVKARITQHEYDHIEGKLFVDHLSPLKRKLLSARLNNIAIGKTVPEYRTVPNKK